MIHEFKEPRLFEVSTPRHGNRYFVLAKSYADAEKKYWEVMEQRAAEHEAKHPDHISSAYYEVPERIRLIESSELLNP